ncbi:MAG: hypothetical protein JSV88_08010 [Candidatus Aminicenantes bacterium]|nr:MAG: hypothetical protein JSV88_08010 [Candidatus Aminicenantes bacterium]
MFCFIYKWMISWALDSGKRLPGAVNRHIGRCSGCREFARYSGSLATRLTRDAPGFLQTGYETHDTLNIKITSVLDAKSSPKLTPGRRFNFRPIPALAAALVVLAVAIGIIFQVIPLTGPGPGENSIDKLRESAPVKNPLQVIQQVESPIESEMRSLGQSLNSAAEFLVSCLDVKIGQQ